jgi:hypothetical protein
MTEPLNDDDIAALIETGYELRGIEFKGPGSPREKGFRALVARAAIALANTRDGGIVIIGLDEKAPQTSGLNEEQLADWLEYDNVVTQLNAYADPPLNLSVHQRSLPNGRPVVVLVVAEFAEVPILSAKDHPDKIVKGMLYTRSLARPESSYLNTQNELREVLELATEKRVGSFLGMAQRAGLALKSSEPTDTEKFELRNSLITAEPDFQLLAAMPHLVIRIQPTNYIPDRIPYTELSHVVLANHVRFRGWPFPYIADPVNKSTWISEATEQMHREAWALDETGLFVFYQPIPTKFTADWDSFGDETPDDKFFPFWLPVLEFAEALTFASRLQRAIYGDESAHVAVEVLGLENWVLVAGNPRRGGFHGEHKFGTNRWASSVEITPSQALVGLKEQSIRLSRDLLSRSGWNGASDELLGAVLDDSFGAEREYK